MGGCDDGDDDDGGHDGGHGVHDDDDGDDHDHYRLDASKPALLLTFFDSKRGPARRPILRMHTLGRTMMIRGNCDYNCFHCFVNYDIIMIREGKPSDQNIFCLFTTFSSQVRR